MSEQVPTITDTNVRQPVDSEAASSTIDTTGKFIEVSRVSVWGGVRLRNQLVWPGVAIRTHV